MKQAPPSISRTVLSLLGMAIALLLIYRRLAAGWVLAGGDLHTYFFPYWTAAARAFQAGELPLWNPYLFAGAPLLANSQAAIFYPLNWPFWLLSGPSLSGMAASLHGSVLLHLFLAAVTTFLLARRLGVDEVGAAAAGLLYAGSGFAGVHVEHLNQLQGLAWLPLTLIPAAADDARPLVINVLAFALILLTGHTQTAFIATLGILTFYFSRYALRFGKRGLGIKGYLLHLLPHVPRFILSLLPFSLGALIAAVQLFPTFELSGFSLRSGGLPWREAVSFSVVPWHAHKVFLPPYLFTPDWPEGVAYLGLAGLLLSGWTAWSLLRTLWVRRIHPGSGDSLRPQEHLKCAVLLLGGVGLFMALGGYNPLYLLGVRLRIPGLIHFRAPARYLGLYVLAASLLAGWALSDFPGTRISRARAHALRFMLCGLLALELLLSSNYLPHADATAPRAYDDLRPATAHLVAAAQAATAVGQPASRFLSISQILFDPGDKEEIEGVYGSVLSPDALWTYLVAAKAREVLAPNLPLAFGVPAVDGYDGGLLPLHHYADFSRLLLPEGTLDGRLRENLQSIPEGRWLSLFDVRFLITDKIGDMWVEDVFYDRQFQPNIAPGDALTLAWLPQDFTADTLGLLYQGEGAAEIQLDDGRTLDFPLPLDMEGAVPHRLAWDPPAVPLRITLEAGAQGLRPTGTALIDVRTTAFYPLVLSPDFRLAHSGDVKLYENLHPLPRAFLVHRAIPVVDVAEALAVMAAPEFDPAEALVIFADDAPVLDAPLPRDGESVQIVDYSASRVVVSVHARAGGYLLLTDAWYPGWQVSIRPLGGAGVAQVSSPLRADLLFRAVPVTPGDWELTFTYVPYPLYWGGGVSLLGILGLIAFGLWERKHE